MTEKQLISFFLWSIVPVIVLGLASCNPYAGLYPTATAVPEPTAQLLPTTQEVTTPTSPDTCTVTTGIDRGALNLRTGPGTNYAVIRVLSEGETLQVITRGDWHEVTAANGASGYVNSNYCR